MEKFPEKIECRKCGCIVIDAQHCRYWSHVKGDYVEEIDWECTSCGFEWATLTKDANQLGARLE